MVGDGQGGQPKRIIKLTIGPLTPGRPDGHSGFDGQRRRIANVPSQGLVRLLKAANDCHLLATAVMNHASIHVKTFDRSTLERLVEACKPLNDYAGLFQPSAAEREALLHRVPTHELEVALHRAYVKLFRMAHAWFTDRTQLQQLDVLHRVQANAASQRMDRLLSFQAITGAPGHHARSPGRMTDEPSRGHSIPTERIPQR
jgi:hypothetical protein